MVVAEGMCYMCILCLETKELKVYILGQIAETSYKPPPYCLQLSLGVSVCTYAL